VRKEAGSRSTRPSPGYDGEHPRSHGRDQPVPRLRPAHGGDAGRDREDPYAVLSRLGARLEAAEDESAVTERLLPHVAAAVAGSLRLPYAALELGDGSRVEHGTSTSRLAAMPLTYGDHDVGRLVVGVGAGGLGRRESRALDHLAGQAAAAHWVLLARDPHHSREALVSAREEERRRLYRDLHDGLGPSLAALALQVETARDLIDDDPGRAAGVPDRAFPRLKGVVGEYVRW
jgi:two-component system, NarL family, sensor kinase